jgi:hypothetical protein
MTNAADKARLDAMVPDIILRPGVIGGSLLATDEETAEFDRLEAEHLAEANAHIDSVLSALWVCAACGDEDAYTDSRGRRLCQPCRAEADRQETMSRFPSNAEVTPAQRSELVEKYRRDSGR